MIDKLKIGLVGGAAIVLLLTNCTAERLPDQTATESTAVDTLASVQPGTIMGFDPGQLSVGDTVLGLRVTALDVNRAFEDSIWVGNVKFAGEVPLTGIYQGHFDYPEVRAVCFHVTDSVSVRRVPRFASDGQSTRMKTWFCFTNSEQAIKELGPPDQPREATIVVDSLTAVRYFSDAWASARLVRVSGLGQPTRRSLREPF